jgi:DNA helicase-2/ATP-dependent DNA helicase PcrA
VTEQKIDFDDLIFEVAQALRTDQLLLQILQEKYLYILVDEHQDTNDAQNLIVRQIADFFENPNLFVVGDEKQAIYRFQGASVENFLSFQKIWSQMKVISLTENYRSHQNILDASFQMIENNYGANEHQNLRVKLTGQNKNKKLVEIGIAENTTSEDFFLIDQIQTTLKSDPESTVAVIVRKNSEVSRILNLLNSNEIEASAERGTNIFAHPVGILFFDLLKFLNDPSETAFLANTLISNLWQTDFGKQIELIKLIKSNDLENLTKQLPQIVTLQKALTQSGPLEYLAQIAEISGFNQLISQSPLSTEIWRTLFELAKDLTQSNKIEDPKKLIESLLAHQKSAEKKIIKMKAGSTEAKVMVMTSHSSKGLEFDYVFLPNATEESWLSKQKNSYFVLPKEKEGDDDLRDDRRLFYVALTRAKKHLVISYSQSDGLGKILSPLRFIDELAETNLTKIKIETTQNQRPSK